MIYYGNIKYSNFKFKMKKELKKDKVSIIIPTYNESDTILKLIKDVERLNSKYKLEIIIVDANSSDNTVDIASKEKVKIFKRNKKYGKGADFWYAAKKVQENILFKLMLMVNFYLKKFPF